MKEKSDKMNWYKITLANSIALFIQLPTFLIYNIIEGNLIWVLLIMFSMWLNIYNTIDALEGYFKHRKHKKRDGG